ncbi:DUF2486 family protein [Burkholderia oklahomensis]|uniref:DUF2486 family protein n=1 Tax=Burkholderia oklahomensis TaxID=342113 RepID=UPI00016A7857|nr:DUF2486 family protein [Burkholderia oklahomensis]AJX33561.1 hypothetical protein BG90_628 [Burkholderia oklahomensis C6786]AOI46787.1 hypothetical protein WI23_13920 [Burkholderia oklahomensis C6786]KUY62963.1 hypothetical protein WI23_08815 [Burkholderia oklahomensis C6786]MBI0360565.1 DUF2486 family protein [Burkholderia oklahomensis]SUW59946.1 Protein of uncharacterised function (DUF2486) [Burkholderia oklahomensis]
MVEANASSIPVLTDVLVPGNPALARQPVAEHAQPGASAGAASAEAGGAAPVAPLQSSDAASMPMHAEPPFVSTPEPFAPELPTAYAAPATYADELPAAHPAPDLAPPAALPSSTPDAVQAAPSVVADLEARQIAARLKSRLTHYLTGEGRGLIEARCRDALQDHAGWLVSQITREVALALETEVAGWVTEEVGAALARRNEPRSGDIA